MQKPFKIDFFLIFGLLFSAVIFAQNYQKPPNEIMDVLNAPVIPSTSVSPTGDKVLLLTPRTYPPISELAQPMLRLAGRRINPNTNGQHRESYFVKLALKNLSDDTETVVELPLNAQVISPKWSSNGKYVAFGNIAANGIELWIIETATGRARKIRNVMINRVFGSGYSWMPDQKSLLVNLVPAKRSTGPGYHNVTPIEPNVQDSTGKTGRLVTHQDVLKSPNDERLFEYYATSQLIIVAVDGKIKEIGQPAIFDANQISPDGRYLLTSRIQRPFSYLYLAWNFPKEVEVWDTNGKIVYKVASLPLADNLAPDGVRVGPRSYGWIPTEPATLVWAEALDGGDPRIKAEHRDKLVKIAAPFSSQPTEIAKTEERYSERFFGEKNGLMLFYDYNRNNQHQRIFAIDYRINSSPKLISDLNINDRYNDFGFLLTKLSPNGSPVIMQDGDEIFLHGAGASPEGDRPFLRKFNLKTLQTQELFRSGTAEFEYVIAPADNRGTKIFTIKESTVVPPNLYLRTIGQNQAPQKLTNFSDPSPSLRRIKKQLVRYKRADGVDLSFILYLPPDYKEGTRLPTIVWAYPLEFTDLEVAGQVSGSTNRFSQFGGASHLFFLLQGYAVLHNTTMPIVGAPETVNDTFIKQIVDSAKAAIDKGVEMGVVDRDKVGVGGHSYGAFMTANLLAHSDLFRAGIAQSGAYNRTLTPFGFQSERRTLWEAKELYQNISPFFFAHKINEPLLLIHGEADNNGGTVPIQSERFFAAIRGTGGTSRLVMLPLESHGYAARESIEHTLYEMINWFDKYVKNGKPQNKNQTARE